MRIRTLRQQSPVFVSLLIATHFLLPGPLSAQTGFRGEVRSWQQSRLAELKSDNGWLTLTGLFWLKQGSNSIGSARSANVELPAGSAPEKVGSIVLDKDRVTFAVSDGVNVTVNGKVVHDFDLIADAGPKSTVAHVGTLSISLIKRGEHYAIRVKDSNSAARREFRGLEWFEAKQDYRVTATLEPFEKPKEVAIPNVLGDSYKMTSPGVLHFTLLGKVLTLQPVFEDEKLFIIFRDETTGKSTYGAGRFLYADAPVNGKVILDFNRAFNPPCAFTAYATCPLPPRQNRLQVAVEAGERAYRHSGQALLQHPRN
jgi:uncharacterized protein (DUF1684 family)